MLIFQNSKRRILNLIKPDEYLDSFAQLDISALSEKGIRGIILDIDNTLVPHGYPYCTKEAQDFIEALKQKNIKACIVSNNVEDRVQIFNQSLKLPYIFSAGKPKKQGYIRAMELMGTDKSNTAAIGDQIFTDLLGAHRVGLYKILVKPCDPGSDTFLIKLKRIAEKIFFRF